MKYYVNKNRQPNGEHEVHNQLCEKRPSPRNTVDLGMHVSCTSAIEKARRLGYSANGCPVCCPKGHVT